MKNCRSELKSDFLPDRMTFALVLRAKYGEIRRLKRDPVQEYDVDIAPHELAEERRYITDRPPEEVDSDDRKEIEGVVLVLECPYCGKAYKWEGSLRWHRRGKHRSRLKRSCPFCVFCSESMVSPRKHVGTVHNPRWGEFDDIRLNDRGDSRALLVGVERCRAAAEPKDSTAAGSYLSGQRRVEK